MADEQKNKDIVPITFEKGLYMDGHTSVQPEGTYPYALNIVPRDQFQINFKSNEHSTIKLSSYEGIIGSVLIKDQNREIIITKAGEIHSFNYDTEESKLIGSFSEFGCTMDVADCEWINIQATSQGCDTYLHWSSNYTYYWVNLSEWENEKKKKALIKKISGECRDCNMDCNYFKVFRPKCVPTISTYPQQTGGSLSAGAYVYTVRLINSDGSVTNWSTPSSPVYIGSDYNIPGEDSNGRVSIELCGLDCNYNQIEIAVTYYDGSQITTTVLPPEYFSKDSYTYTHTTTKGDPIQTSEILLKGQINLEGSDLKAYDGYMYYFGIRPTRQYNVQKIANGVKVEWVAEKYSLEDAKRYQIKTIPYGETLAFGLVINHDDGTNSFSGHIPCTNSLPTSPEPDPELEEVDTSKAAALNEQVGTEDIEDVGTTSSVSNAVGEIFMSQEPEYKRERKSKPNMPGNLSRDDELTNVLKDLVDSYNTDINDLVSIIRPVCACPNPEPCCPDCEKDELNMFCNVCGGHKDADIIAKNIEQAEDIGAKWSSILGDYIGEKGKKDLIRLFKPSTIKEAGQEIINAVKRRERVTKKGRKFSVTKNASYNTGGGNTSDISSNKSSKPSYPGGSIVARNLTECKQETRLYPCITDCNGDYVYGDLAGTPIRHHKFPDETQVDYFESKSIGVPSVATPDADEYKDVYVVALGAKFDNIVIPSDYEQVTGKRVCKNNPYTIVQIKLNDSNKSILAKGMIHSNYISTNKGKEYDFQRHAVNSRVQVNRYIDTEADNDERRDNGAGASNTVCMYSLDQSVLQQYIGNATKLKVVKRLRGIGYRHYLYREGKKSNNLTFGRRIDKRGCVSATNLSQQIPKNTEYEVSFAKYVGQDVTEAPGSGGVRALINKKGQPTLWIGLRSTYRLLDDSFLGDVLNHEAPIEFAQAEYAVLYRELADQYGSLESANYIPILEACNASTSISGLFGDRFISPYSYVRTSWVSDKVGNSFPIGQMVDGKSDRSICDGPEDAINALVGKYFWTELPKDNDPADPKNWAGTYTTQFETRTWQQSRGRDPDSHYYYPGTVTHMNTFVGESEANPFMLELSDDIKEQRYPTIRPTYSLEATNAPWEESYLSQFGPEDEQPSPAEKLIKVLGMSLVNLLMPALGVADLFSPDGTLELAGDLASLPIFVALFLLMSKVLFTADFFDEWLGLPKCQTDEEGGIKFNIKGFFTNYHKYSYVFSQRRDLRAFQALQNSFNCGCETGTTNDIYVSDRQIETSSLDAYKSVRPNSFVTLSQSEGKITDMFVAINGSLCAHSTDGIWVVRQSTANIATSGPFDLITGTNKLIPQLLYGGSGEGYAGLKNRNHSVDSAYGRFFVDYESSTLYNFNGKQLIPLDSGVKTLFDNYLKYCTESECSDEFAGQHITLGIDTSLKRLLITKADGEASWTLSYDLLEKTFTSFHSYVPNKYLFTRDALYAIKDDVLYRHSVFANEEITYGNFYGEQYGFEIDAKAQYKGVGIYGSHVIRTDAERREGLEINQNLNYTFNKIQAWNSRQTAGSHNLIPKTVEDREMDLRLEDEYGNITLERVNNEWRVNELYDYTEDGSKAIIKKKNNCLPFIEPCNYGDCSKRSIQTQENRVISDNFLYTRFIADHLTDVKLYIKNMLVLYTRKTR